MNSSLENKRAEFYSLEGCSSRSHCQENFHEASSHLTLNLIYTYQTFTKLIEKKLAEFGLSLASLNALIILREYPNCTMSFLKDMLLVSGPSITSLIDNLEKKKLVKRSYPEKDRRSKTLILTEGSHQLLKTFLPHYHKYLQELSSGMQDSELYSLSQLLSNLRQSISGEPGKLK